MVYIAPVSMSTRRWKTIPGSCHTNLMPPLQALKRRGLHFPPPALIAFRKPVAYVHGDSHYFLIDRPFLDALGRRLENFTRVETFGNNASAVTLNNDVQWLKILVDPKSREVFAYQAQIVPANRVAVPAP